MDTAPDPPARPRDTPAPREPATAVEAAAGHGKPVEVSPRDRLDAGWIPSESASQYRPYLKAVAGFFVD